MRQPTPSSEPEFQRAAGTRLVLGAGAAVFLQGLRITPAHLDHAGGAVLIADVEGTTTGLHPTRRQDRYILSAEVIGTLLALLEAVSMQHEGEFYDRVQTVALAEYERLVGGLAQARTDAQARTHTGEG